jgi:hypothetical protein
VAPEGMLTQPAGRQQAGTPALGSIEQRSAAGTAVAPRRVPVGLKKCQ